MYALQARDGETAQASVGNLLAVQQAAALGVPDQDPSLIRAGHRPCGDSHGLFHLVVTARRSGAGSAGPRPRS